MVPTDHACITDIAERVVPAVVLPEIGLSREKGRARIHDPGLATLLL